MRAFLLLVVTAAACTHYPDDCNRRALQELRTVNRLIEETRTNLARGYTYEIEERRYGAGFVLCTGRDPVRFCTANDTTYRSQPVAVDPAAERRKLESLLARREILTEATAGCVPV